MAGHRKLDGKGNHAGNDHDVKVCRKSEDRDSLSFRVECQGGPLAFTIATYLE
jgi:hypothetical protein